MVLTQGAQIDLTKTGLWSFEGFEVEVIDPLHDYVELLKTIFDFGQLKAFVTRPDVKLLLDAMHGGAFGKRCSLSSSLIIYIWIYLVTGPYVKRIFVEELGAAVDNCMNVSPSLDFGGYGSRLWTHETSQST
jgi:phosphoglucomutase